MLAGFPIKEYLVKEFTKDGDNILEESKWVPEVALKAYFNRPCGSYEVTQHTRMSYAPPAWLPIESNPNGTILLLDDFSRANSVFMQSIMELVDRGQYMTWKLPEHTTVILSSNPDDGSYSVQGLDDAQTSRMCKFTVDFNMDDWALWAEMAGIDNRAINFALNYSSELFENRDAKLTGVNARSYTMFCNLIQGISDWENPNSLGTILSLSKGCFSDPNGIIGSLFAQFLQFKLDKLISPKDMLLKDWKQVSADMRSCIYGSGNQYNGAIASILTTRLTNYIIKYFTEPGGKDKIVCDRLIELVSDNSNGNKLVSEDLVFNCIKTILSKFPGRTKSLLVNPMIRNRLL